MHTHIHTHLKRVLDSFLFILTTYRISNFPRASFEGVLLHRTLHVVNKYYEWMDIKCNVSKSYSGYPVGGNTILMTSLMREDFMTRSLYVVKAKEGDALTCVWSKQNNTIICGNS